MESSQSFLLSHVRSVKCDHCVRKCSTPIDKVMIARELVVEDYAPPSIEEHRGTPLSSRGYLHHFLEYPPRKGRLQGKSGWTTAAFTGIAALPNSGLHMCLPARRAPTKMCRTATRQGRTIPGDVTPHRRLQVRPDCSPYSRERRIRRDSIMRPHAGHKLLAHPPS